MATFNPNLLLLSNLTRNKDLLNLFKQMTFLIHRNTYGGLNKHDLSALESIKKGLVKSLDDPEKEYLTKLIDSLSLYDLPEVVSNSMTNKLLETEVFSYVAKQSTDDLCDILIEHLPARNGLLLSIEINDNSLALVSELVEFSMDNAPDKITDLELVPCNIWQTIRDAKDLPDNHIHIAFITHDDEPVNFLCFKGLCIAKKYLEDIQEKPMEKAVKVREKKPFMPTFGHGIAALARKVTGVPLNSNVVVVRDIPADGVQKKKGVLSMFKGISKKEVAVVELEDTDENQDTSTVDIIDDEYDDSNDTNLKGRGFFDVEQGFLFNIT